jgi:DNA-binding PadR family transcriptional regulator
MSTILKNEVALLMLLSEGPKHPYQIEKDIQEASMDYWTELSQSSIYKTLRKLEEKGFATSEVALNERNVGQKTYTISEAGLAILKESLHLFLRQPEKAKWRIDLATSHLDLLPTETVRAALDEYEVELRKLIDGYRALEGYLESQACPPHSLALARRPMRIYEGELLWLEEYRRSLGLDAAPIERGGRA